jgi:hydroxymethylpyrimidine pyrophosphatase-like HAD family hydrolase
MIMNIKLVAMDFDLTVFDYRNPAAMLLLAPWFDALTKAGVMIGTASGRTIESLRHETTKIGMEWGRPFPSFSIVEEGVILTPEGEPWPGLALRNLDRSARIMASNAKLGPLFKSAVTWAAARDIPLEREIQMGDHGVNVVFDTPENAERVRQYLLKQIPDTSGWRIARNHHIVIGLPEGSDKGVAVRDLAQHLRIPAIETLVIGDNLNDLCMFDAEHAFQTATVGNAVPEAKAAVVSRAGYLARGQIAHGVAEIFGHVFGDLKPCPAPVGPGKVGSAA